MFVSFFPRPRIFFPSIIAFTAVAVLVWYFVMVPFVIGNGPGGATAADEAIVGLGYFVTREFMWFYVYYVLCCAIFAGFWFWWSPHPWQWWSICGSMLILFSTYFSVQISVAINNWRRPFFDAVQNALGGKEGVTSGQLYGLLLTFAQIAFVAIAIYVCSKFFISHFIFRWRTAMNNYYMSQWPEVRKVEGAAQRVQEDTMQFARIMEELGVSIVDSIMTLFAFLPVLFALSKYVTELPIVGSIAAPLFVASIFWSLFGTVLLAVAGIKLPGLHFRNQRVEAAYRKELVYGEDNADRAGPMTARELFDAVRTNYFRLYFHYAYFNVFRSMYLQADNIFVYVLLVPTIAAGKITFGLMQQILTAFGQVSQSFQYLVNSWTTIVELLSIRKRLLAFEAVMSGQPLPDIDQEFLERQGKAPAQ